MKFRGIALSLSVLALGASMTVAQVVLLRECLNLFAGNELVLGILLGNWLLAIGIGSLAGRWLVRGRHAMTLFLAGLLLAGLLPPALAAGLRAFRAWLPPGLALGAADTVAASLLAVLPYGLAAGMLLPLGSHLMAENLAGETRGAGRVYVLDVAGGIAGGALFSFYLVHRFSPFQTLTFLFVLLTLTALLLAAATGKGRFAVGIGATFVLALVTLARHDLERTTGRLLFPGQEVLYQQNTPYGCLTLTGKPGEYTVFENGLPLGSTSDPAAAEEAVHTALAQVEEPKAVLLVGGGVGGTIGEVAKHRPERSDYVELDPAVLGLVERLHPDTGGARLVAEDGRRFIQRNEAIYDAVILSGFDPVTMQANRFFTREFFAEVRRAMKPGGVFGFSLPGAENYAGPEARALNAVVRRTLARVFPEVLLLPGNRTIILASDRRLSPDIGARLAARGITTSFMTDDYLKARFTPERLAELDRATASSGPVNRDLFPHGYLAGLKVWLAGFGEGWAVPGVLTGLLLAASLLPLAAFGGGSAQPARRLAAAPLTLWASGLAGMGLEVVVLILFQGVHGVIYEALGLLFTAFFAGAAAGGAWGMRAGTDAAMRRIMACDLALLLLAAALAGFLALAPDAAAMLRLTPVAGFALFLALPGFFLGAQFPLAVTLLGTAAGPAVARLYCADYLGAALGAIAVALFGIPQVGLAGTCVLLAGVKAASSAGLILSRREAPAASACARPAAGAAPRAVAASLLALFATAALLMTPDATGPALYAFTFRQGFHWMLLLLLSWGLALRAWAILPGRPQQGAALPWPALDAALFRAARVSIYRLLMFAAFGLVVFFPLFRCYFRVPYLFCHACPRHCVFGYLRPYLVPAALIMNLEHRAWCFEACPIGTLCDAAGRFGAPPRPAPIWVRLLPLLALGFTVVGYFKVQSDEGRFPGAVGDWYNAFFRNAYTPSAWVMGVTILLLAANLRVRRAFCEHVCPVGTCSRLLLTVEKLIPENVPHEQARAE